MHWKWWLFAPLAFALMVLVSYEDWGLWPSVGIFALVVPCAFFLYRQDSRSLVAAMKPLAAQYGGTLRGATLMSYSQLEFETDGRRCVVHAMPNAGTSGQPGPFTHVQLTLPFNTACQADVTRAPALVRGAVSALVPQWQATTGDVVFDKAFRLEGRDGTLLADLLNGDMRARLTASTLPALRLRLRDNEIGVFMDGLAKSRTELEEMIALAEALADRCRTPAKRFL